MDHLVVIDTNVFVSACLGSGPANDVLRTCLQGRCTPLMGAALFAEYEDVLQRDHWARASPLNSAERERLFEIFLSRCRWTRVYFGWRPNLPDEADNHLIELAIAGGASHIVTRNLRDLARGELRFEHLRILDPLSFLKENATWAP
ncbi:MAG: hypothetical protein RL722_1823 [Pseudomonadota bacterium]|jgi:putative PIN family toxin of toxin-antitoxin system